MFLPRWKYVGYTRSCWARLKRAAQLPRQKHTGAGGARRPLQRPQQRMFLPRWKYMD